MDDRLAYRSPVRLGSQGGLDVSVPVSGARSLRLVTAPGDGDLDSDHADWALATLR